MLETHFKTQQPPQHLCHQREGGEHQQHASQREPRQTELHAQPAVFDEEEDEEQKNKVPHRKQGIEQVVHASFLLLSFLVKHSR